MLTTVGMLVTTQLTPGSALTAAIALNKALRKIAKDG
jgi:hypothetical protein